MRVRAVVLLPPVRVLSWGEAGDSRQGLMGRSIWVLSGGSREPEKIAEQGWSL